MRDDAQGLVDEEEGALPGESFLQRLHRRKHEARLRDSGAEAAAAPSESTITIFEPPPLNRSGTRSPS